MARFGVCHYVRLVSSTVGLTLGAFASIIFFFMYGHLEAATWAFCSALMAFVCLKLHILYHRNMLQLWHSKDTLQDITLLGVIAWTVGFASMIWYIFIGLYHHRAILPVNDCPYISAVWSFMTAKWGMFIFFSSRMYSRMLTSGSLPLLLEV